jgi:hypothetical protein
MPATGGLRYGRSPTGSDMAIDLKSLKKLESLPASAQAGQRGDNERMLVLVKLRKGATQPSYVSARSEISAQMFSTEISAGDLARLEADPSVESVSLSRKLPIVE